MNDFFVLGLSGIFFIGSLIALQRARLSLIPSIFYFFPALAWILVTLMWAVSQYFTGHGINDAVIYHLKYGLEGSGFGDFLPQILTSTAALILGVLLLLFLLRKSLRAARATRASLRNTAVPFFLLAIALIVNPAILDLRHQEAPAADGFSEYYLKPEIKPSGKPLKNLVMIYAESLERTYFDENLFPGLMTNLKGLEPESLTFTDIRQEPGTGWTIGGMTASQCGMPLVTPSNGNSMSGMDKFLPGAVCLGDLLKSEGYYLSYMGGARLKFAGKGKFYTTHGFDEVLGREALSKGLKDPSYTSSWGLYDDSLLDMAFKRYTELSGLKKPFGLFLLTLDTHHPKGHLSRSCAGMRYQKGSNAMLNAVACSDQELARFITNILASPAAERTTVVLMSDHLAMKNGATSLLKRGRRRDLLMIFTPGRHQTGSITTPGSTLDVGTTLLPFLGFEGKIGLGRNLMDAAETLDPEKTRKLIYKFKKNFSSFWEFPRIRKSLEVDPVREELRIDDRSFRIPVLAEINDQLEATLRFQFNRVKDQKTCIQYLVEMDPHTPFILVDTCRDIHSLVPELQGTGFCLLAGRPGAYTKSLRIEGKMSWSVDEIQRMLRPIPPPKQTSPSFLVRRVAHAGGGIRHQTYTNSLEALNHNFLKGFRYFELDFSFTSDDRLICLHDWKKAFRQSFGFETDKIMTLKEFEDLVEKQSRLHKCTLDSLADWMRKHPQAVIVTDVKARNIAALKMILKGLPDAEERIIPQIYNPANFKIVRKLGFQQIIWTLYRLNPSDDEVLRWVEKFTHPFAVTMPKRRAVTDLPMELAARGVPTYVHTINKPQEAKKYLQEQRVSEVYTDFLPPD